MTTGIAVSDCLGVGSCDASSAMLLTMLLLCFDRTCWCPWVVVRRNPSPFVSHSSRTPRPKSTRVRCGNTDSSRETLALAACAFLPTNSITHSLNPHAHSSPRLHTRFPSFSRSHVVVVGGSERSWIVGRFRSRIVQAAAAESIAS